LYHIAALLLPNWLWANLAFLLHKILGRLRIPSFLLIMVYLLHKALIIAFCHFKVNTMIRNLDDVITLYCSYFALSILSTFSLLLLSRKGRDGIWVGGIFNIMIVLFFL
jgi:hypothetical protein